MNNNFPKTENLCYSELPVYVHIPFCSKKCGYCDFFSISKADSLLQEKVVQNILIQLELLLKATNPLCIPSVYIGGGTPNSLPADLFYFLIQKIASQVNPYIDKKEFEWTVELNPEFITHEQLSFLMKHGVNRISVGVQSFSQTALNRIERNTRLKDTIEGLEIVSTYWDRRWNMDIITGLPQQSINEAQYDLTQALSFHPPHISLYTLTIEDTAPLYRLIESGKLKALDPDLTTDILWSSWDLLRRRGYHHYEISNFALPNEEGRHNLYYWQLKPYAGIGPGAVSTLIDTSGRPARAEMSRSVKQFAACTNPLTLYKWEQLTAHQFLLEYLIMGLRTIPGIDINSFYKIFNLDLQELLVCTIRKYRAKRKLQLHSSYGRTYLSVNEPGMMLLDSILLEAAAEIEKQNLHIAGIHWPLNTS